MTILLGVLAGIIFLSYSFYFYKIMLGKPEDFELELLKSLADWMVGRGTKSRSDLWTLYFVAIILEIFYFILVFTIIKHPVLLGVTGFFVGIEVIHMAFVARSFSRFFSGKIVLKELFNWKMERISGLAFFTHSFLLLVCLIFF
ncbi:MAG: hypothetical protein GX333_07255 [Syntrophomonadaceae bacterium]|nr:hypothetical protein [Syntrophomonadaceae bacterium]